MADDAFHLEERRFTHADFERIGWHDNPIHAVAFGPGSREISFDIE